MTDDNLPAVRVGSLADKVNYAQHLAQSGLLPGQYRKQPANLLYAIEYAEMLGLPPMAAITGIHVIEGKPTASAALISALVRRAGHKLRVKGDDKKAVAQIIRKDDPGFMFESVWTVERAQTAGLLDKKGDTWHKYRPSMLKARAIVECARDACEEALSGMHYTPEELGAEVDADGEVVTVDQATDSSGIPDAEVVPEPQMVTDGQLKALHTGFTNLGIGDRDERLTIAAELIGRTPMHDGKPSSKGLTVDEFHDLMSAINGSASRDDLIALTYTGEVGIVDTELPLDDVPVAPPFSGDEDE